MNEVTVIDRFLDTFSRYIGSGFGLLQGERTGPCAEAASGLGGSRTCGQWS